MNDEYSHLQLGEDLIWLAVFQRKEGTTLSRGYLTPEVVISKVGSIDTFVTKYMSALNWHTHRNEHNWAKLVQKGADYVLNEYARQEQKLEPAYQPQA
ncbi:hypothetical protein HN587_04530 [Candidatus Woesearchaeota archaeon]|jgi:hypothetical protein|nr:hypothetical protein [Candidatus Woesearchaeota archaeon]